MVDGVMLADKTKKVLKESLALLIGSLIVLIDMDYSMKVFVHPWVSVLLTEDAYFCNYKKNLHNCTSCMHFRMISIGHCIGQATHDTIQGQYSIVVFLSSCC